MFLHQGHCRWQGHQCQHRWSIHPRAWCQSSFYRQLCQCRPQIFPKKICNETLLTNVSISILYCLNARYDIQLETVAQTYDNCTPASTKVRYIEHCLSINNRVNVYLV